ncbi:hypothetical protein HanRHA438_Chr16g0775161 [Helianthus annuus]|nr:hypothetical protein HanRHA438_Chr16g0775161 [Helianthus annuus]
MSNTCSPKVELASQRTYRASIDLHQLTPQQVRFQEASGLNRTETKRIATRPSYRVAITPSIAYDNTKCPPTSFISSVVFVTRISSSAAVPLVVDPCRDRLRFHTVSYDHEYLDVATTVASNIVACNGVPHPFTIKVHLFTLRAMF